MSLLVILDETELPWMNVLPTDGITFQYPDLLLEWAPTTQPTASSQTYTPVTERLREFSWGYGRNDEQATFEAGSGYVLIDNRDRAFDPSNTAGTWFGNIKPRKAWRLRYRWNGVVYPGFVAYSRGYPQTWPSGGFDNVVRVDLVDAFAVLANVDLIVGFTRPVESSDQRIAAVLDACGIPAALRALDTGSVQVEALNVTSPGTSALEHAKAVAQDAELGQLFVAKDGKVTFHNRQRRENAASVYTFTDDPAGSYFYGGDPAAGFDDTYLWNYLRVSGSDDTTGQVSQDAASQADHFVLTKQISSKLNYANDRQALGDYYIDKYAQAQLRIPALPFTGATNPSVLWPALLGLEVSNRVTVRRFSTSAAPMVLTQNVEGIQHRCIPGGSWTTTVPTSPADTLAYWQLEIAGKSELDNTTRVAA